MKATLRKLLWFILQYFEQGDEPYKYKPLNRQILNIVGALFCFLSAATIYVGIDEDGLGFLVPAIVFFGVGFVCLTIGLLGSDRAVAKIWGNR